ncbi:hypothetical protein PoB_005252900 [Plakobranchus ocellatus]|uniref:Uncharacterized protein n=1 Tax=Plakobranchus ocellatus TaxID=259542 RepID=A0AAV4C5S2_9GAST|nr:hypothetical protein PoB_005252900 [Plakobranchus ocellatus]
MISSFNLHEVDVSWTVESIHILLSPYLLRLLDQLLNSGNKESQGVKDLPKPTPMTHEDFELCRRVALEEERQRKFSTSNNIDVPPLTIERHMEMMHGVSAGSLLMDEDMFFSANLPSMRRDSSSAVDISDSASVSTFGANSTLSTTNASAFSHARKSRENTIGSTSKQRGWDDNTVSTQNVNITLPFLSLTVLLEDPEMGATLPEQGTISSASSASSTKRSITKQELSPQSASYPPKMAVPTKEEEQLRPSSVPKSFSSVDPVTPLEKNHQQCTTLSFKNGSHGDEEDNEEEDVFHDSGDYFEPRISVCQSKKDQDNISQNPISLPQKRINATHKTSAPEQLSRNTCGSIGGTNSMQRVAVAFFQALSKLDFHKPLHNLRDEIASILPFDHLGVLAKPVHVELAQESKHAETKNKLKVAFGKLEVIECLFDCFSGTSDFTNVTLPKLPQYSMHLLLVMGKCGIYRGGLWGHIGSTGQILTVDGYVKFVQFEII